MTNHSTVENCVLPWEVSKFNQYEPLIYDGLVLSDKEYYARQLKKENGIKIVDGKHVSYEGRVFLVRWVGELYGDLIFTEVKS